MPIDLFKPFIIGNMELKNRFVRSSTQDALADASGAVTDASLDLYRSLAKGGSGLIITGVTFISLQGKRSKIQYGIYNDDMIWGMRKLVRVTHQEGAKIALQLHHGGIYSQSQHNGDPVLAVSK
ncbi:MAG: hypothetical protein PHQ86_05800, partial [Dehalococcoidales bacterium]|nr:hypothetical protein [Dehalococcoidales bacterium]